MLAWICTIHASMRLTLVFTIAKREKEDKIMRGKKNPRKGELKQFITIVGNKQGILLSKQGRYRDARGSKKRKK